METSNKANKVDNQSPHPAPRQWLVAYTRMHHEKKVQERLTALDIESFLPIHTEVRQWSDRKKKVDRVLISIDRKSVV